MGNVIRVEPSDGIPDGDYSGTWSGNVVKWETSFGRYVGNTADFKNDHMPCTVTVDGGQFSVVGN